MVAGKTRLQHDRLDNLIGGQPSLLVTGVELCIGDAPGTASGNQHQLGLVNHQRGKGIGGWRCVHNVAAEGAAVLIGDAAGPGSSAGKKWKLLGYLGMASEVGVGAPRANDQFMLGAVDA